MATHETVRKMTDGQKSDIIATMMGAIPPLTFDEAQGIVGEKGPFVAEIRNAFERRRKKIPAPKLPHYADGEVFEMTLDGDAPENHPLEMVRRDGYTGNWKHSGPVVKGIVTRRFKWVAVGYQPNLETVRAALAFHGDIPEGQWREAVKQMFKPDGEHLRGIADPSWENPDGYAIFPYVENGGYSDFRWAGLDLGESWCWLVAVSK